MINKNYEVKVYSDLKQLSTQWSAFEKISFSYCFQSYDWVNNWISTIGNELRYKPKIVIVKDKDGQILMILPLALKKYYNLTILSWIGGDYGSGLYSNNFYSNINKNTFLYIWEIILKKINHYDLIYLSSQPLHINSLENPFVKFFTNYPYHALSHQISLNNNWDLFKKNIKKKLLKDTERQQKRLEKIGKIKFKIANSENMISFTEKMIILKSAQYNFRGVKNQFSNKKNTLFYRDFKIKHSSNLIVHVSHLVVDKSIIATHWGIIDNLNKVLYYLMPAYDNKWSKYSPGRVHMIELIKWCINNDIKLFDMTGGNEPYKLDWGNQNMNLYNYLSSKTLSGFLLMCVLKIRNIKKRKALAKR
jgi:CelD/BcsL family acetyltransferase involved in cellulose biosynthesis